MAGAIFYAWICTGNGEFVDLRYHQGIQCVHIYLHHTDKWKYIDERCVIIRTSMGIRCMKMPKKIEEGMIAPCGVNCLACSAHLAAKNPCPGCRAPNEEITRKSCRNCAKKQCAFGRGVQWCFQCSRFRCARIKSLDQRYKQNYGVDLLQNGSDAKRDMDAFLQAQRERFACTCGGIIDQHHKRCSECGKGIDSK